MNFHKLYKKTFAATLALTFTAPSYAVVYSYDKLHRLSTVKYNFGQVIHYTYDPAGNMASVTSAIQSYSISLLDHKLNYKAFNILIFTLANFTA